MSTITYLYPIKQRISFTLIAEKHIKQLRDRGINVRVADIHNFRDEELSHVTLVHPILYPLISSPKHYRRLYKHCEKLIGFDVADTDKLSPLAAYVVSTFDLVFVPAHFIKLVYLRSGALTRIEVLPHGVDDIFFREAREPKHEKIREIQRLKGTKFLFFLWHSGYRKGADVVAEAFTRLAKENSNVYLIVKMCRNPDPFVQFLLANDRTIILDEWLSEDDLVDLYDVCDVVLVPSRGGGFELNALEAMARGKITIVSDWGAFNDYAKNCVRVTSKGVVDLFIGDRRAKVIHSGKGANPDPQDLYEKMKYVLLMKSTLEKRFKKMSKFVKNNYTWNVVGEKLFNYIKPFL